MPNPTLCLLLNWNGAPDTIQVAEAVLAGHPADVIIADNASSDLSRELILKHFKQKLPELQWIPEQQAADTNTADQLRLVAMDKNWGFARSINTLIKSFASGHKYQYIWLLNNDAIPADNALQSLLNVLHQNPEAGFAGSVIMDFSNSSKIQCCGLKYYPWAGVSKMLLKDQSEQLISTTTINSDFQHGASLLVSMRVVKEIGLMDEQFFLYFEEQDWQMRAAAKGITNITVPNSKVYHKGSQSTAHAKHLFYYYYNCSAIYYARKHSSIPVLISAIIGLVTLTLIRTRFRLKSILWGLKGLRAGIKLKIQTLG